MTSLDADASPELGGGVVGVGSVEPPARVVESGGNGSAAGFALAAGIVVLTMTALLRGGRLRRKRGGAAGSTGGAASAGAEALSPLEAQSVAEASRARLVHAEKEARSRQTLETLMVEVQELTRLCAGQIENRAVRLERLIAEADVRLAELRALEARVEPGTPVSTRAVRAARASGVEARGVAEALPAEALRRSSVLTAGGAAKGSQEGVGSGADSGARVEGLEPLTRRVYEMADRGASSLEIARRLEEQIGKVELILSLRRG